VDQHPVPLIDTVSFSQRRDCLIGSSPGEKRRAEIELDGGATLEAKVRWSEHTSTTNPEFALMFEIDHYTAVCEMGFLSQLLASGWRIDVSPISPDLPECSQRNT
jgi:hypothetical protein